MVAPPPPHTAITRKAKRGRLGNVHWESINEQDVRAAYARVAEKLHSLCRRPGEAASCLNYLYHFALEWNRHRVNNHSGEAGDHAGKPKHPADLCTLNGTSEGVETAYRTFEALKKRQGWGTYHLREVRSRLSRALACTVESLAAVVNPTMRRRCATSFFAPRSHCTTFTLHECLPNTVVSSL